MLVKAKALEGFRLKSLDGEIGKVKELYFDDRHWTMRYLVADTGSWLFGRQVLISPHAVGSVSENEKYISVNLTKEQIEESPSLESDKPVSRQFEEAYFGYYKWPAYWCGAYAWGDYPFVMHEFVQPKAVVSGKPQGDSHLRSTNSVSGYHIQAIDGEIGHVNDFIFDDDCWTIRYLEIDTKNWWLGKKVLFSPQWIENVSWEEAKVVVNLYREAIQKAPEYTDWSKLTREFEISLHSYYDRPGYWADEAEKSKADVEK